MAFSLSFADAFYMIEGDDELSPDDMEGRTPVTVYQALLAMDDETWEEMAKDVFNCDPDCLDRDMVIEKIRETDTCSDLTSPVSVWIDDEGNFTIEVYDDQECNQECNQEG